VTRIDFDPVEAQLQAYNGRDVEAFLACYTDNCVIEDGAGKRLMAGHAEMRPRYHTLFDGSPNLNCVIVNRIRIGSYVIDEESISGRLPGIAPEMRRALAIYHLDNASGLIDHVRFLREFD